MLNIVKQIIAEQGENILADPQRLKAFFSDLARDIPKSQKNAFIKCLDYGFVQTLKNVSAQYRSDAIKTLAQKLNEEEGLELGLCTETVELLAAALFGKREAQKKTYCRNCGKELAEGWKACPYCGVQVVRQGGSVTAPVVQAEPPKPKTPPPAAKPVLPPQPPPPPPKPQQNDMSNDDYRGLIGTVLFILALIIAFIIHISD
jgi:hypothetical protein